MRKLWFTLVALHLLLVSFCTPGCGRSPTAPTPAPPLPPALIESVQDTSSGVLMPDGTYAIAPTAANNGKGCAGSVAGSSDFNNTAGFVKTVAWQMPPAMVIRPNERFNYSLCCLTRDQAFSAGIMYFTRFTFTTVACQ